MVMMTEYNLKFCCNGVVWTNGLVQHINLQCKIKEYIHRSIDTKLKIPQLFPNICNIYRLQSIVLTNQNLFVITTTITAVRLEK